MGRAVLSGTPEFDLLVRLREVLADQPVTESELRALSEQADGLVRALRGQVEESEGRLDAMAADPSTSISELAKELRRVEVLLPTLSEADALLARLDERAKELRGAWLHHPEALDSSGEPISTRGRISR